MLGSLSKLRVEIGLGAFDNSTLNMDSTQSLPRDCCVPSTGQVLLNNPQNNLLSQVGPVWSPFEAQRG